jgi:hypothetical protein
LLILDEVCKSIGATSPVGFYEVPVPQSNEKDDGIDSDNADKASSVISYPYSRINR